MVQTERKQEYVVVTKICFYGSAKTEWKIKVCAMENKGSVAKMIEMRGNNSMLTSKLYFLSSAYGWTFCNLPSWMSVCGWVCLLGCVLAIFCAHLDHY